MQPSKREPFKVKELGKSVLADRFNRLLWRVMAPLPDSLYVRLKYRILKGHWPDLENPVSFGEKVQARKLYDRNPLYPVLVDKHAVKAYVADRIGEDHVLPVYWAGKRLSEVDWDKIPLPVVVKPNHASGLGRFLYTPDCVRSLLENDPSEDWLKVNHARYNREWAYSQVEPQILVEKMLVVNGGIPWDFRVFTFDGVVSHIMIDIREGERAYSCTYAPDWTKLPFYDPEYFPHYDGDLPRPAQLDTVLALAARLGRDLDFARIDFFVTEENAYLGEITLYPGGGYEQFEPAEWETIIGERWTQRLWNRPERRGAEAAQRGKLMALFA